MLQKCIMAVRSARPELGSSAMADWLRKVANCAFGIALELAERRISRVFRNSASVRRDGGARALDGRFW